VAGVFKRSHSYTYTHRIHLLTEWTIRVFAFTATKLSSLCHIPWVPIQNQRAKATPYWASIAVL